MIDLGFNPQAQTFAKRIVDQAGMWVPKIAREIMGEQLYAKLQNETKYCVSLMLNDTFQEHVRYIANNNSFEDLSTITEEVNTLAKHYEKMHKQFGKPGIFLSNDMFSRIGIKEMQTLCYCRNLQPPFDIYNKGRYLDGSDLYRLYKKGNKDSTIYTVRHPYAETEDDLKSDQAKIERDEFADKEIYFVRIKNSFIGALNRYAIVASVKPPVFHCGCFCIINGAGCKLYVYAVEFNNDLKFERKIENKLGQWNNSSSVMAYGFTRAQMEKQLLDVVKFFRSQIGPKLTLMIRPEHTFEEKINWFQDLPDEYLTNGENANFEEGENEIIF